MKYRRDEVGDEAKKVKLPALQECSNIVSFASPNPLAADDAYKFFRKIVWQLTQLR